jgi:hypothetical protein
MGRLESLLHRNLRFVRAVTDDLTIVLLAFPGPADSSKLSILTWRRLDTASSRPGQAKIQIFKRSFVRRSV